MSDLPIKEAISKVLHEGTIDNPMIANDVEHLESMLTLEWTVFDEDGSPGGGGFTYQIPSGEHE